MTENWIRRIIEIKNEEEFNQLALEAFQYQIKQEEVYAEYCHSFKIRVEKINHYSQIPFLPISFFKSHQVLAQEKKAELTFTSSGTTGMQTSRHPVADVQIYEQSFEAAFRLFYGDPRDYCILALLPSYLEREGSSLVYMADRLIALSQHPDSGFYLHNYEELAEKLETLNKTNQKILVLGVTYALLDLAEMHPMKLKNASIMETGGMKGRRKEMIREELHELLCKGFGVSSIHSEYGMTELLSQGYSFGNGLFKTPPWMKILIRDTYDPFTYLPDERGGAINVIDLANIYSCCFIETQDLGKTFGNNQFTILGRFDNSDIRGCNLLVS